MRYISKLLIGSAVVAGLAGCGNKDVKLTGAGATFPNPLYTKMFYTYHIEKGVQVNYQSIGSGGGVKQITTRAVDFGASDAFITDKEMESFDKPIVHIPTCLGAVAITYNLKGAPELRLSRAVLADIFLGKITRWNDEAITSLNSGVTLPDLAIQIVHRSDGSGTTAIFTDYLTKISDEWKNSIGEGKSVQWPTGVGAKGNEGVSGMIQKIDGSIGYVELAYTIQTNMPAAYLENKSGNYVKATLESTSLAGEGEIPADTRISLTDSDAAEGYPIAGFTWLIIYQEQNYDGRTELQAKALVDMLKWVINQGQVHTMPLHYAPIPKKTQQQAETILKSVTFNGKSLI
jgi:phosphate transport system substrate-binding protein